MIVSTQEKLSPASQLYESGIYRSKAMPIQQLSRALRTAGAGDSSTKILRIGPG